MFTGIVKAMGRVNAVGGGAGTRRLTLATCGLLTAGWRVGDSVSVAGVCLTVAALGDGSFDAELSGETARLTTLGRVGAGARVNLEPAVVASDALGGHLVTGHVDGLARALSVEDSGGSLTAMIEAPEGLARYLARKGSVALDGVSLTVAAVDGARFRIDVVPATRGATTLGALAPGQELNIEVDLVARYVERLLGNLSRGGA
jgi:riboflavin synthase